MKQGGVRETPGVPRRSDDGFQREAPPRSDASPTRAFVTSPREASAGSAFADGPAAHAYAKAGAWNGPPGLRRAICLSVGRGSDRRKDVGGRSGNCIPGAYAHPSSAERSTLRQIARRRPGGPFQAPASA